MEYKGKLYGHLGGKMYFDTGKTANDQDVLEKRVSELEAEKQALRQPLVSGSLRYDEKLLIDLWYKRNPCHELNSNSGEDIFWKTAFMVFEDYVREVSRNDR